MSKYGFDEDAMFQAQQRVMDSYARRFNLSKDEQDSLHMAHSPRRVPQGLTSLQVRRRINKYKKYGNHVPLDEIIGHRIEVRFDGNIIYAASMKRQRPENRRQLRNLFRDFLKYS